MVIAFPPSRLAPDELIEILEALGAGDIGMEEAARRAHILDTEPGRYNCGTCRFFHDEACHLPGQPVRAGHQLSVRCGDYQFDDPRDHALPAAPVRSGSRMFK